MSGANIKIGASSDEFKKQMQEVSRQLKLITSECGLAAQKAKLLGTEQERLATIQKELTGRIQAQTQIIKLYQDRLVNINGEIDREKTKQGELSKKIDEVTKKREEVRAETGRNSEESQKLTKELEKLREAYAKSEDNINSSKNSLVDMTSKMNNAEKKLLEYKKSLEDLNKEIANAKLDKLSENFDRTGEALTNAGQKASIVGAGIIGANIAIGKMALDTESDLQTLSGRLGLTSEEAESLKQVAKDLYNNGFGESLGDCVNDIVILQQNIKETSNMTNEQKLALLEQISTIKTLFGAESTEITRTLNNMINNGVVENFQEGLDIITTGFQQGLNSGGDLLDVLYEYSPQFKKLGLNGQSALSYIKTGLEAGGYNADKMADALKELSIRAIDGSKTTAQGFELIGLNADEMARKFAAGGDSAKDALDRTIEGLKNIQDPIEQDLAGVNLFGTMWEDSSKQAILSMNGMSEGLQDVSGATEKAGQEINSSFNKELASTIRESKDAMLPLGQEILNLAKVALPMLKPLIEALSNFLAGLSDNSKKAIAVVAGIATVIGPTLIVL
ncbi:MAG: phage tail tape measure protein, partial [Clostridium sp.]